MVKIESIKKVFKKVIIILCCLMLFLFPPKINDDFVFQDNPNVMEVEAGAGAVTTYLTWEAMKAAAVAAGSAVAPVAIGIVAVATIGLVVDETIGWDVVADYGQGIINHVLSLGGTVDDIYDADSETVSLNSEFLEGAAVAIDDVSTRQIVDANGWAVASGMTHHTKHLISVTVPSNHYIHFKADVVAKAGDIGGYYVRLNGLYKQGTRTDWERVSNQYVAQNTNVRYTIDSRILNDTSYNHEYYSLESSQNAKYGDDDDFLISNVRYIVYPASAAIPDDAIFSDDIAVNGSTVDERKELMTNTIGGVGSISLQDNQAVTGVSFAEMASATTPEDIDESNANDLGILGILRAIYNYIKSLPVRIVGAFTSLFNMIINAIKAIPDVITSGIDNLLININNVGANIRSGIDDLLIDVNNVGANIRAGLDDLLINMGGWADSLINGIGAIPGTIADAMSGLLSGLGSFTGSITDAIADAMSGLKSWLGSLWDTLIGLLSNIWDFIAGLAQWLIALIVPTSIDALQPSITSLTNTFNQKFEFILFPIRSFGNAYSESKSLYDVTFKLKYKDIEKDVHVLPIAYKPAVDVFRLVANGVVVVLTYISMYNRFRKEVIAV